MTDDIQQARVKEAAKAARARWRAVVATGDDEVVWAHVASAALAAADAHLPNVEQIAEVLARSYEPDYVDARDVMEVDRQAARAVHALFQLAHMREYNVKDQKPRALTAGVNMALFREEVAGDAS